jgi:serine/threonine protein kinase
MDLGIPPEDGSSQQLENCPHCESVLDVTEIEPLSTIACPNCDIEIKVGNCIGPFQLVTVAGRGGMGVVYRAFDAGLNREVALKVLRRDQSGSSELIEKLATEAAITASINHPHVVRVFSTGVDAGRFYLAMELVDKGSLDDLIRIQGCISEVQALQVGIQIAMGLRAALQHDLIHRDVKPANILFSDPNSAKIVDFGLALFMEQEEAARGEVWGTPYYVAPEKLDGKPEDFRSDIYSLGGTLFHALTGRPPFEAPNASLVAYKHLKSQPVRIQAFAPHISSRTAYIIDRTLLKDPAQRYQSYDELIEHLQYAKDELIAGKADSAPQRIQLEDPTENKASSVFAGIILLLILAGCAFGIREWVRSSNSASRKLGPRPEMMVQGAAKLAESNPAEAERLFRKYASQKTQDEDYTAISSLLGAVACLETGNTQAQAGFVASLDKIGRNPKKKPIPITSAVFAAGKLFQAAEKTPDLIPLQGIPKGDPRSLQLGIAGLILLHSGQIEKSMELLREFRLKAPTDDFPWMEAIISVAGKKVDEFTIYRMDFGQIKALSTPLEKRYHSYRLMELGPEYAKIVEADLRKEGVTDLLQPLAIARRAAPYFRDDFVDFPKDDKHKVDGGKWQVLNGVLSAEPEAGRQTMGFTRLLHGLGDMVCEFGVRLSGSDSLLVSASGNRIHCFSLTLKPESFELVSAETPQNAAHGKFDQVVFSGRCSFSEGQWHLLRLEIVENHVAVSLDGKLLGSGGSPVTATKPKGGIALSVTRGKAEFRELNIWKAEPKPQSSR